MKTLCNLHAIFNLAHLVKHESSFTIATRKPYIRKVKRIKKRLIEEFIKESEKLGERGVCFEYDNLHTVYLRWSVLGIRTISLSNDLSKTFKGYRNDYLDVPVPILKASIRYFHECNEKEKRKISS